MFYNSQPVFESNMVLRSELLQESADYAAEMFSHMLDAYSDGIITGVSVTTDQSHIVVHPGIIKYQGILYHMASELRIDCENTGVKTFLKLRFHDEVKEEGRMVRTSELVLTEEDTSFPYEMELGRFTLEQGASLRSGYNDFADMATQYNRFNIQNVKYAGRTGSTVSPLITRQFAKELLAKNTDQVYDIAFAMQCMGNEAVERDVIGLYLGQRLGPDRYEVYSNEEIYQAFSKLLNMAGRPARQNQQSFRQRKVIVD